MAAFPDSLPCSLTLKFFLPYLSAIIIIEAQITFPWPVGASSSLLLSPFGIPLEAFECFLAIQV